MENQPLYDLLAGRYTIYEPYGSDQKTAFMDIFNPGTTITFHHATGQLNVHHMMDMVYGLESFRNFILSEGVLEIFNAHDYQTNTAVSVSWPQHYSSELARSEEGGWDLIELQTVDIGFSPGFLKSLQEKGSTGSISDMRAKKAGVELTRTQKLQSELDRAILSRVGEFFAHGKATRQPVDVPPGGHREDPALLDRLMAFSIGTRKLVMEMPMAAAEVSAKADTSTSPGPLRRLGQALRSLVPGRKGGEPSV